MDQEELDDLVERTLTDYGGRAGAFWEGTKDHDVSQNRNALIRHLVGDGPHRILDFGCGPGRDVAVFRDLGYEAVGLDGCPEFCQMAREFTGCEVLHQSFLNLDLGIGNFDGIFANASMFHVPKQELPRVLSELHRALRKHGVFFSSNPRGQNQEGWNGTRFGSYHNLGAWRSYMKTAGFEELEHYYRPPGKPRHEQPWLASVWRKI